MKYLTYALVFGFMLIPLTTGAQETGLVNCGLDGSAYDCNFCTLMEMVNAIVRWLIAFLSIIAVGVMVYAGFKMVTSGGSTSAWEEGKSLFTNVVIGIIIVLAAWLIVDTVLETLTGSGINEWFPSDCGGAAATGIQDAPAIVAAGGSEAAVREQLRSMGYTVNKQDCGGQRYQDVSGGCTSVGNFTSGMMGSLSDLRDGCANCSLVITGGSEAGHQTHGDGNSVDFRFDSGLTAYINSGGATRAGLRCVAEGDHWHCRR